MSSRWLPNPAACFAVLLAALVGGAPVLAHAKPSVVAACANPALPGEILPQAPAPAPSASPLAVIEATGAAKPLRLAVAADTPNRELGLMCVTALRPARGMIFVFSAPSEQPFWMKNTLISLDMIWVDEDGTVTSVAERVPASTRETPDRSVARRSGFGRFVIELGAGEARANGIVAGTRFALPPLRAPS